MTETTQSAPTAEALEQARRLAEALEAMRTNVARMCLLMKGKS